MGKTEFFYPRGLEALGREFVSKRGEAIRFDVSSKYGFRAVVEQEVLDLKAQDGRGPSQVSSEAPMTPRASRKDSDRDDSELGPIGNIITYAVVGLLMYGCYSVMDDASKSAKKSDRVCNAYTGKCESRDRYERREKRNKEQYDDIIDSINNQ